MRGINDKLKFSKIELTTFDRFGKDKAIFVASLFLTEKTLDPLKLTSSLFSVRGNPLHTQKALISQIWSFLEIQPFCLRLNYLAVFDLTFSLAL